MEGRVRLLLVEGHAAVARRFARVLRRGGFHVEVAQGVSTALHRLRSGLPFNGVLFALMLPDGPGELLLDAAPAPFPRFLVITACEDSARWVALLRRGCLVLRKPVDDRALLEAADLLLADADTVGAFAQGHQLSPRETELLRVTVTGLSAKQAAEVLGCAESTVWTHWHRIYAKTGCGSQAAVLAKLHRDSVSRSCPHR